MPLSNWRFCGLRSFRSHCATAPVPRISTPTGDRKRAARRAYRAAVLARLDFVLARDTAADALERHRLAAGRPRHSCAEANACTSAPAARVAGACCRRTTSSWQVTAPPSCNDPSSRHLRVRSCGSPRASARVCQAPCQAVLFVERRPGRVGFPEVVQALEQASPVRAPMLFQERTLRAALARAQPSGGGREPARRNPGRGAAPAPSVADLRVASRYRIARWAPAVARCWGSVRRARCARTG